jgi:VanZ family protein
MLLLTSVPGSAIPRPLIPYDKVVHFTAYGLFAVLLTRAIFQVGALWRSVLFTLVIAAAFGAADEWHQRFVPGRRTDLADWRADFIGAAGGALLFTLLHRDRRARILSVK